MNEKLIEWAKNSASQEEKLFFHINNILKIKMICCPNI